MSEHGPEPGGAPVATVTAIDGGRLICQLHRDGSAADPVSMGSLLVARAVDVEVVGVVYAMRSGRRGEDEAFAEVQLLGELDGAQATPRFRRGVSDYPQLGAPVRRARPEEEAAVYAVGGGATAEIGRVRSYAGAPASVLVDHLLGKHFAVLGSTGSGKSSAVVVLLQSLVRQYPHAHILLIDPHAEYARAFGDRARVFDARTLRLPFWMLTFEELAAILAPGSGSAADARRAVLEDAVRAARLAACRDEERRHSVTVDTPLPYRLSDLEKQLEEAMGRLDRPEGTAPYRQVRARLESLRQDPRYGFLFPRLSVRDEMAEVLGDLFCLASEGRPITVLDTSGMASDVVEVVVSVLCRLAFEYGLWSPRQALRPLLVVCEEAHRYVPEDRTLGFEPSRRAIDRLAKEGRKYGISLGLVTQRPSELSTSALSQCGTVFALRLSNERDRAFVENVLPEGAGWMVRTLPALATGEALVVGDGVPVPMIVRLRDLPDAERPSSATPPFSDIWGRPVASTEFLDELVQRWRREV